MRFGELKYYLTMNHVEMNKRIKYLTEARKRFIDKDIPTIDVDNTLFITLYRPARNCEE